MSRVDLDRLRAAYDAFDRGEFDRDLLAPDFELRRAEDGLAVHVENYRDWAPALEALGLRE